MNQSSKILNDIVSVVRDGKAFYETATPKVHDPELKELFKRMAAMKGEVLAGLSAEVKSMGEIPAADGPGPAPGGPGAVIGQSRGAPTPAPARAIHAPMEAANSSRSPYFRLWTRSRVVVWPRSIAPATSTTGRPSC